MGKNVFAVVLAVMVFTQIGRAEEQSLQKFEVDGQSFYMVGDQLLDAQLIDAKSSTPAMLRQLNHTFGARPVQVAPWPDGVLPFEFADDVGPELRATVIAACQEWAHAANIHCQIGAYQDRVLNVQREFLGVITGCWSMLGSERYFLGLKRRVNLAPGCETYSTVLHELGHALGLAHEHQRSDRDQFVEIHGENVDDPYGGFGYKLNFQTQTTELLVPYDFRSIMHYPRDAFSKNGQDTIVPKAAFAQYVDEMGRAEHLSEGDKAAVSQLYGAPREW